MVSQCQGVGEETAYEIINDGRPTTIEFVFFLTDLDISHPRQAYARECLQKLVDKSSITQDIHAHRE